MPDAKLSYAQRIEKELESCMQSQVSDLGHAGTDEVVRDLHRVLLGNGNPTRGLLFKYAETRVDVNALRSDVLAMTKAVTTMQNAADAAEKKNQYRRNISRVLWDNKGFIILTVVIIVCQVLSFSRGEDLETTRTQLHRLERRISEIVPREVKPEDD